MTHPRRIVTLTAAAAAALLVAAPAASAAPGAKLRVAKIDRLPASVAAGDSFELSGRVRNSGRSNSAAELTASLRDGGELGSDRVKNVPAKRAKDFDLDATVPADTPAGTYRVRVCVPRKGTSGKRRCRSKGGLTVTRTGPPAPVFTPGARSAGDPLFPQIGNGGYDAIHYDLGFIYQPDTNTFPAAGATITARATQNLSQFSLDFQDQLEVLSVTVNGQPAQFAFAETEPLGDPSVVTQLTKLVVTPQAGIPAGSQFTVAIGYSGTPVHVIDADGSSEGWIPACYGPDATPPCDGAFVVNQPNGAQGWFPSNNYPTDKATFDTTIVVPSGYEAFGIGELDGPVPSGPGQWVWSWSEDDPTSTYLTTATVGQFDLEIGSMLEQLTSRTLPIYDAIDSSYSAEQKANVNGVLDQTPAMTNYLGGKYGPYPYDSIGAVVDRTVGVGYALEVATKPHYSQLRSASAPTFPNSIHPSTHLHEIAHQWFGNAVTLEQWTDIWFNEGWAQWSEFIWDHEVNGGDSPAEIFDDLYVNTPAEEWEVAPAVLDGDPSLLFSGFPVYDRGSMVIEATRQILGEDGFGVLIDRLMTEFRYDNISTEEFIELVKEISGFSGSDLALLDEFYDQWLYGEEKPALLPDDLPAAAAATSDGEAQGQATAVPRGGHR